MQNFVFYKNENHLSFTKTRNGETKLGETIKAVSNQKNWKDELKRSAAKFVIIGIPEDIGVKANLGIGGTHTVWPSFLSSFFNIQHNQFLNGETILLLGYFDFSSLQQKIKNKPIEYIREIVIAIDKQVSELIRQIVQSDKIPIIIGGGHNNAYGNIKGAALGLHKANKIKGTKINVVNLDAHADFRAPEGRHSGNAFSYAMQDGYLNKYGVLGLHENYMTQPMYDAIKKNKNIRAVFFEDLFIRENSSFEQAVKDLIQFTKTTFSGIEIDLDAIENVLTSATTPAGVTVLQARQFIQKTASKSKVAYLHICEGIAASENGTTSSITGKLISYLVSDFIKAIN